MNCNQSVSQTVCWQENNWFAQLCCNTN